MNVEGMRHLAIIMDGNGRWARRRGLIRSRGHREGVTAVREVSTACARAGLPHLTLFALSTENYRFRPAAEVSVLMALLKRFLVKERPTLMENDIQLRSIGRVDELPAKVQATLRETEELSRGNQGMVLTLALNYGGRAELADAVRRLVKDAQEGGLAPNEIDEASIQSSLYDPTLPDVDLLVRTGGDLRISNFLLWQVSYAEIWVTQALWPDFRPTDLDEALGAFHRRQRRFGRVVEGV